MKKSIISIIHVLFWLGNLFLFVLIIGIICQSKLVEESDVLYYAQLMISIIAVPGIIGFYTFYYILFPKYLENRELPRNILLGLILAFISSIAGGIALYYIAGLHPSCHKQSNYVGFPIMSFFGFLYGSIAIIIKGFITWYAELKEKEALQQKNHEMEMALIKSQLDPHFLFNTLNNIDVLIIKSAEDASLYLNKLSDIMRFMLFETKTDFIELSKEIEYINKYISLQKIRTKNARYINFEVIGNPKGKLTAPMVFIPFIENAFKHASNKKIEDAIIIKIKIEEETTSLYCNNFFNPDAKKNEHGGLGNELIEKRLKLIYGQDHTINYQTEDDRYIVELKIKNGNI